MRHEGFGSSGVSFSFCSAFFSTKGKNYKTICTFHLWRVLEDFGNTTVSWILCYVCENSTFSLQKKAVREKTRTAYD